MWKRSAARVSQVSANHVCIFTEDFADRRERKRTHGSVRRVALASVRLAAFFLLPQAKSFSIPN